MHKNTNRFFIVFSIKPLKRRIFGLFSVIWFLLLFYMLLAVINRGSLLNNDKRLYIKQEFLRTKTGGVLDNQSNSKGNSLYENFELANDLGFLLAFLTAEREQTKKFDILINSYMRSGSSFTGQLLAFRPNTFYWYEPLLSYKGLYYFMGRYACIGNNVCGDFGSEKMDPVNELLQNIYTCNFTSVTRAVADNITSEYSGENWKLFKNCRARNSSIAYCLASMEDTCKHAKHRATKVVRLTVDNLEYVLQHNMNLKVIHLFRDPRAVLNSELTTKWYNLSVSEDRDFSRIKSNAYDLCSRMKYDLVQGEKLKRKYPQRFAFVMFEDLQSDLSLKTEILYSYFGIDKFSMISKLKSLSGILQGDHVVNRKQGGYTDWWRFQLDFKAAKIIDEVCADILTFFGYRRFSDESEYRDLLLKGFDFRQEILISNLNKTQVYDFEALRNSKNAYTRSIDLIQGEKITGQLKFVI